jgi:hypothetical protein
MVLGACTDARVITTVRAGAMEIDVTATGAVGSLREHATGREHILPGRRVPLLRLRVEGQDLAPRSASHIPEEGAIDLHYGEDLEARVLVTERDSHASFELTSVSRSDEVDLVVWGPYPTTIDSVIGETVGVVRGPHFAVGIQSLNPKTLGGYPWNDNDQAPQMDIFEGDPNDLSPEGKRGVLYRVEAAKPDTVGSTLQAYTRNRLADRVVTNMGYERYVAPAFDDGGVIGSRIALFGSPVELALETIGRIEVAEGLPHPTIDGQWGKQAPGAAAAYVIMEFGEETVGEAIDVVLRSGLRYLYHSGPFETWGHFELDGEDFPNGVRGLAEAVRFAEDRGVMVGVHTLSNFVTTDDPYVTPVPDPRLARVGTGVLAEAVSAEATELSLESPDFFGTTEADVLQAAVLGDEIIRYRTLSDGPPWRLLDLERGAFGTRAAAHERGVEVGKLADHGYRVFLTDAQLGIEMAGRLAELFNQAGLRQISFDGLEGNRSTGMGNYGEVLFTTAWYEGLSESVRSHFIADASRTSHYFWHIYSRMNWGEPWYAGFRESQTEYRLKNQPYFERNMMPRMLGWFSMRPETSVEDIEWMLARSAAFDAGYGFVTSFENLEANGRTDEILELIGRWEEARLGGIFSAEQKSRMEDVSREFHLEREGEVWSLTEIRPHRLRYEPRERQPGEPGQETLTFENPEIEQPLALLLTAVGAAVDDLRLELDATTTLTVPGGLSVGETLVYEGGPTATVYSDRWLALRTVDVGAPVVVTRGPHRLSVAAEVGTGTDPHLKIEVRVHGEAEDLPAPSPR